MGQPLKNIFEKANTGKLKVANTHFTLITYPSKPKSV